MMEKPSIPQDDLLDVMEMTRKIEGYISKIIKDADLLLGMSALMSSTINSVLDRCTTLEEVMFYRTMFAQIFDHAIKNIKIK